MIRLPSHYLPEIRTALDAYSEKLVEQFGGEGPDPDDKLDTLINIRDILNGDKRPFTVSGTYDETKEPFNHFIVASSYSRAVNKALRKCADELGFEIDHDYDEKFGSGLEAIADQIPAEIVSITEGFNRNHSLKVKEIN